MRQLMISVLLASAAAAATPALAAPDGSSWHSSRPESQETRSETRAERRQAREQRMENSTPPAGMSAPSNVPTMRVEREPSDRLGNGRRVEMQETGVNRALDQNQTENARARGQRRVIENRPIDQVRDDNKDRGDFWRRRVREVGGSESSGVQVSRPGGLVQPDRPLPRVLRTRTPVISDTPREGTQPPLREDLGRRTAQVQWNTNWRHNSRYDWRDWRRSHRSHFHLGFYYDPFGWGYQPYTIGWRLWPSYYGSRYWITDPWHYRLPYAPPGYRWIRYYDDLLLVDLWDGEVVDVVYDFFW